ncbi:MAG: phosphoserine phosphatase RsbU/P, partial [Verrucomicrobiota bacterium]
MWPIVFLGLLIASLAGWGFSWWRQRIRIRQLERSKEEIQIEETLVFDFLHGLGEAFTETIRATDLHRLIVEGAGRVLDAQGGALYMMERAGGKLAPAFISKGCPPFIDVPTEILQEAASDPGALENYLRLHAIPPGEGIIGRVWQTREPVLLTDLANAPELAGLRGTSLGAASVMVTPLLYGKQNMGVLALGNGPSSPSFAQSDFVVFKSIAEQSAFALYNAIIYSEANEKKRLDHDLEIARDIQRILLPSEAPVIPGFEIAGLNIPARHV